MLSGGQEREDRKRFRVSYLEKRVENLGDVLSCCFEVFQIIHNNFRGIAVGAEESVLRESARHFVFHHAVNKLVDILQ